MSQTHTAEKENIFIEFFHSIKEYILVFAMVLAALKYLAHYIEEISENSPYLKWLLFLLVGVIIFSLYFFTFRPQIIKRRELNMRPTGEPDENYFTTSPRDDDKFNFFATGYEKYLEWLRYPKTPILYLTGPSGSGKSSLINAYLMPQLEKGIRPKTSVYSLRSYHDPLKVLYDALKIEDTHYKEASVEKVLAEVHNAAGMLAANEQILIVLDQFEEFFLLLNKADNADQEKKNDEKINELKRFFHSFLQNRPKNVYILLSYRDDFQQLIDKLELPARTEHVNFEQINLLTLDQAAEFLKNCPGLQIPDQLLKRILKEAASIDSPITLRPIVLNLLGIILKQMAGSQTLPKKDAFLIRQYIIGSLGKELQKERIAVLKAMLTDFNTARPRTAEELAKFSGLSVTALDNQLIVMGNRGLVRCLDKEEPKPSLRKWQIAHDFIALQLERVVYGISATLWHKTRPWVTPTLVLLLLFTSSYIYSGRTERAINRINKAGFSWDRTRKMITPANNNSITQKLSDSSFKVLMGDIMTLAPDSLTMNADSLTNIDILKALPEVRCLKLYSCSNLNNLDGLKSLTMLTTLSLTYCNKITNTNALKKLTKLTSLKMTSCPSLIDISGLRDLKMLTLLDLSYCSILTNIDAITNMTRLTSLRLRECNSLIDISGLAPLTELTDLDLYQCNNLTNIDALKNLSKLATLNMPYGTNLENVDGLNNLKSLISLRLSFYKLTDLDVLKNLTNLTTLEIFAWYKLTDISAIGNLTKLTSLEVSSCYNLSDIKPLQSLKNLTSLKLDENKISNITPLKNLTQLTSLNLSSEDLIDIDVVKYLHRLTSLRLTGPYITKINALAELTSLTTLKLYNCPIEDVNALKNLTTLTSIDLSGCDYLADIDGLKSLASVTSLDLERCKSLTNIDVLKNLTALKDLNLSYCNDSLKVKVIALKKDLPKTNIKR